VRGSLSRAEYLRWVLRQQMRAEKRAE
jgi:hypothetical protein